ncbi:HAMP domain-containing sensor histidine kinase [Nonomuraea sp. NPDC049504]|uniref:sensor histidine kinase n=1 Tax=Nonomuraea sp. NPDC049504 TaxID=3154729 RepID=UPI00343EDCAF
MSVIAPHRPADPGRRPEPEPDPGRRLLRRARRRVTVQVAGAFSVVLALVGVLVWCAMVHSQGTAAMRDLAVTAARSPVAYPPPCVWLYQLRSDGTITASPGAPAELPLRSSINHVSGGVPEETVQVTVAGQEYLVHTRRRGDTIVQAALDLRYQVSERQRLLQTLFGAEVAGLLAALVVGQVVARRAIAPLGEALARQRRFAADVSHELRTPLTRLNTRAQLLSRRLRGGTDPILLIDEADHLVIGTRQLGEVVEDLLCSAQFQHLRRPFGPVDLAVLAAEVAAADGARAAARGVDVQVRCDGPGDHVVRGVESALRRVVSALLDNALGHTGPGGHIGMRLSCEPGVVLLTVEDDGVGLDPADTERLFGRFEGTGFGLGLALVREVVEGHHGTITADGRPGEGAAFTVRLPAHHPGLTAEPRPEPASKP